MNKIEITRDDMIYDLKAGDVYQHANGHFYLLIEDGVGRFSLVSLSQGKKWANDEEDPFWGHYSDFTKLPKGTKITITVGEEYKFRDGCGARSGLVFPEKLTELPPYHDFKRGEPVMAVGFQGCLYRKYFSHVGSNGGPFCFQEGKTEWASEGRTSAWESVRKLTPEEREEYNKCL